MSLGIITQSVKNMSPMNSAYLPEGHMIGLESELQPDSAESTYIRVIEWNDIPTDKDLQSHLHKFDLLKVEEKQLQNGNFDIIEKSESTYERFLYAYSSKQQSTVTIFIKVNFNTKESPSSMKYFITKANCALKNHGIIDKGDIVCDETHSNSPTILNEYMLVILTPSLLVIYYYLASFYQIIGEGCSRIGFYQCALFLYKNELKIRQKQLAESHPDLASLYNKIGVIYFMLRDHSNALLFYKKELEIKEKLYSRKHQHPPSLIEKIRRVYDKIDKYGTSIPLDENRPQIHPNLASLYKEIGLVYSEIADHQHRVSFLEAAVEIERQSSRPNSRELQEYERTLNDWKRTINN